MSLPTPNLDDRKFQDIVDDVKRQIGLRCPEWTEHNVSDPGVTLLELFAYVFETALYRINQVPEKNHVKFLEMLGISLEMARPARTELRFRLAGAIDDRSDADAEGPRILPRHSVAATIRTETEDAIEFATESDLILRRPNLVAVISAPAPETGLGENANLDGGRELSRKDEPLADTDAFGIFGPTPREGDALYFCFDADVSSHWLEVQADCLTAAATGLNEDYPAQVWEWWMPGEERWTRLEDTSDTTRGFNRSGSIELALPPDMSPRVLGGRRGYWIRCRYTTDPKVLPPRGVEQRGPDPYQKPPEVTAIRVRTVGGTVSASNVTYVGREVMGRSDGKPGQAFSLRNAPILEPGAEEVVLVGPEGSSPDDLSSATRWTRVKNFALSGPDDRHYVCDPLTGQILFGPSIVEPDGEGRQYGAVPDNNAVIGISEYRVGGSTQGNVRENTIRVLKSSRPGFADVTNPRKATGGRDQEFLEHAKMRAAEVLQVRERAVTAGDYELLAQKVTGVGRARCIQVPATGSRSRGKDLRPGTVRILVIPALGESMLTPRPNDLKVPPATIKAVASFLNECRLLTTVLEVKEPDYLYISTDIRLVSDPLVDADVVARLVQERLTRFLHPLLGGPNGDGWPFRRALTLADVYAQVGSVRGVAFLLDAKMFVSELVNYDEGVMGSQKLISNAEGLQLEDHQLLCTREHNVRVVPITSVGADVAAT